MHRTDCKKAIKGTRSGIMGKGSCLESLFGGKKSRQVSKLKGLLALTVSRISVLQPQRRSRCAQAQADVAHLLLVGQHDRALLRAEMVIRESNMLDIFTILETYCHLLAERAFLLHSHAECPDELREAAAGLSFAASRCGELPELRDVRRIFSSRFGKEFVAAAIELRNNCGVSSKMVQKFSTRQPSLENRAKVVKEIAIEKGIKLKLVEPTLENVEITNQAMKSVKLPHTATCDIQEFLCEENLDIQPQDKYKDAGSAALAAFKSATYAAAAAKTALELLQSETRGRDSSNPSKPKQYIHKDLCCSSIDLGCRTCKVNSCRDGLERPKDKEIINDEIDNDEELARFASEVLRRTHSFSGMRGANDLKAESQYDADKDEGFSYGDEEQDKLAIIAVEAPKNCNPVRFQSEKRVQTKNNVHKVLGENLAVPISLLKATSFSVRTRR